MVNQRVADFIHSLGLDEFGIAPAQLDGSTDTNEICPIFPVQAHELFEPKRLLPGCQSIIVVLFPYYFHDTTASNLSLHSRSIDYHLIVHSYLDRIASFLKAQWPHSASHCIVDTSPLSDRWLAYKAGLGFFGENTFLINEKYGSYCFIGSVLTTIPFEPDVPQQKECLHCKACVTACPGHCLKNNSYTYKTCKSYLTQKKGDLTAQEIEIIRKTPYIYGCDECQRVCPHNKGIAETPIAEFKENRFQYLTSANIEDLTNKEFKEHYGNRSFAWRGKRILLRNIDYLQSSPHK